MLVPTTGSVEPTKHCPWLDCAIGPITTHPSFPAVNSSVSRLRELSSIIRASILADEPTGNLDSRTSVEVMEIFQRLNEHGLTIILVTHEHDIAQYATRQIVFRDGKIVSDTPVVDRLNASEVIEDVATVGGGLSHGVRVVISGSRSSFSRRETRCAPVSRCWGL